MVKENVLKLKLELRSQLIWQKDERTDRSTVKVLLECQRQRLLKGLLECQRQ